MSKEIPEGVVWEALDVWANTHSFNAMRAALAVAVEWAREEEREAIKEPTRDARRSSPPRAKKSPTPNSSAANKKILPRKKFP